MLIGRMLTTRNAARSRTAIRLLCGNRSAAGASAVSIAQALHGSRPFPRGPGGEQGLYAGFLLAARLARLEGWATRGAERAYGRQDRVDVWQVAAQEPRCLDPLPVANQEGRADRDVAHAERLE